MVGQKGEVGVSQDKVQGLEAADCPRCVIYCKWLLPQCRERPNFLKCILFTDEALTFCPMKLHMLVNKYDFKRWFSINVYRLDETVSLWKSTESRNY
ncbi:hypothetical protein Zmor_011386 [Zophobas morio]|uniref:Uncharacterized protein n=1 Tax=Zophobas morio TaxID=2755281 RepID=A0AA38ITI3_9CUCU|nr:hypothetical protein Zmor_011386 [Zophobas morio]